jgi:hypothetical protein
MVIPAVTQSDVTPGGVTSGDVTVGWVPPWPSPPSPRPSLSPAVSPCLQPLSSPPLDNLAARRASTPHRKPSVAGIPKPIGRFRSAARHLADLSCTDIGIRIIARSWCSASDGDDSAGCRVGGAAAGPGCVRRRGDRARLDDRRGDPRRALTGRRGRRVRSAAGAGAGRGGGVLQRDLVRASGRPVPAVGGHLRLRP